jgi:hypothetical protein
VRLTPAWSFAVATLVLAGAIALDPVATVENVIADALIAATLTVLYRAYARARARRQYAAEATEARRPFLDRLSAIDSHFREHHGSAVRLAEPAGMDDWFDDLTAAVDPFGHEEPRPRSLDPEPALPEVAELQAAFDALHAGYPGADVTVELQQLATAVASVEPTTWKTFAEQYNAREPLTPGPLLPSLAPNEAGFEYRRVQHEAYAAYAAVTLRDAARALDEQNAVVQRIATRVRSRLATDSPAELAARYTDDPFPSWVRSVAVGVAALSSLAWALAYLVSDVGPAITDNVLVGLAAASAGAGLAALAVRVAREQMRRRAAQPLRDLDEAVTAVRERTSVPRSERAAVLRLHRDQLRDSVHRLQHIACHPRLDTYGDLVVDLIDEWLRASDPGAPIDRRMDAALEQLRRLIAELFADPREAGTADVDF